MNYESSYERSIADPENFWAEQASEIDWFKKPTTILSKYEHSLYRWYEDGELKTIDEPEVIRQIRETVPVKRSKVGFQ